MIHLSRVLLFAVCLAALFYVVQALQPGLGTDLLIAVLAIACVLSFMLAFASSTRVNETPELDDGEDEQRTEKHDHTYTKEDDPLDRTSGPRRILRDNPQA